MKAAPVSQARSRNDAIAYWTRDDPYAASECMGVTRHERVASTAEATTGTTVRARAGA